MEKEGLIKLLEIFFHKLSKRKYIVFESNPDFSCNTFPVYEKIKNNNLFKDYKLVWFTRKKINCDKSIVCIPFDGSKIDFIRRLYYTSAAKCFVSCNRILPKVFSDQVSVFLSHGSKTKVTRGICEIGNAADYVMVQSHFFDDVIKYEYNLKDEQLAYCGYPRCDYFVNCDKNISELFGFENGSKYIVWLPTFRRNVNRGIDDAKSNYSQFGMPIIYNVDELKELNEYLKQRNMYILFKAHPVQDISTLKAQSLSNFLVINDKLLAEKGLQLYELLAKSSALLTDYSSVFFDYLLLDNPIGTTTDDIAEWKEGRGFAFDLESMYDEATTRIPDFNALLGFIECVYKDVDEKKEQRLKIKNLTNIHKDGNSAQRVADFIYDKIKNLESIK
ncbi:MAG: CDP-glycerol glycerophosphotransferase family protein [Firmicutes bacterium]|nr:CDP-glycerol glycerophosphotransferase family protein [Bacillota bacterium]